MSDKNIFYVEITDLHQSWVAAVCETKETIEHFIKHLPLKIKSSAQIKMLDGKSYPVYAIESYKGDRNSFKLVDQEELFELIRNQKEYTVAHEDHIYFSFYTFETDYFQHPTEKSLMGALNHTHVNNEYLQEETLTKSEYHSEICSLSDKYDIDGLDKLYNDILISDNKMTKYDLAHYGYLSILWNLLYDCACNKLPESGLGLLPDLVENSELLLEKKNWQARVQVEFALLENACKKPTKEIITFLRQLIESLHHLLEQSPEETEEVYQKQALAYAMVANTLPSQHAEFWEKAILALQNSINENVETADWSLYARLVFMPAPEINSYKSSGKKLGSIIQNYQKLEQENFKNLLNKHANYNEKMPYLIALNLHQLKEHMEWEKVNLAYFPEQLYFYWLDQAIKTNIPPLNRIDLNEACHFFHTEGVRLGRIDLLEKAIGLYDRITEKTEEYSYEIHYLATAMEDISKILYQSDKVDEANSYVNKAYQIYAHYIDKVKDNYSVHLHYAEFLERCFKSGKNILKPNLATLKEIAIAVEKQGKGFYSDPIFMRMRIALLESKEDEAIYHLTKSLILHELCIDNEVDQLIEDYKSSVYSRFYQFLIETQDFMHSVKENYYFHPQVRWEALSNMTILETTSYWKERQNEIKSRPKS